MNTVQILAIGRNPDTLKTVITLINKNQEWSGFGAITDEEAIQLSRNNCFDLFLLTNGIDEHSEQKLRSAFLDDHPDSIIIQHYGGGSGLLTGEILHGLMTKKQKQVNGLSESL
jgi:FMN phosphatase YigB (HAD superfamily)